MEHADVKRLAMILAVQAEIEGMKIENKIRLSDNLAPAYGDEQFSDKAMELRNLAFCNDDQL